MNSWPILFAMLKADVLERTRRYSFLLTLGLVLYIGYAVNTGQILIKLGGYRGIYNSAWVGGLMALVTTFFLGIIGFFLVKNTIDRDERSGVGQIIATTAITRPQYLLGKWLSNLAVLSALLGILTLAAIVMQLIYREDGQIQLWALIAPLLLVALPMMALVAALAVFFETVPWLKGGFGNLVYFFLFFALLVAGVQLVDQPWLDVIGFNLIGSSMKGAARNAIPGYDETFVLAMISDQALDTFVWLGVDWTVDLVVQRLLLVFAAIAVVLLGSLFFNRFDSAGSASRSKRVQAAEPLPEISKLGLSNPGTSAARLTPLSCSDRSRFHWNFLRLVWFECALLVKGLKWYWLAGMAALWLACAGAPTWNLRRMAFMLAVIWPVLVWSKLGEREARYGTEQLIYHTPHPTARLIGASWLAGVLVTAVAASGALVGRLIFAEPLTLVPWLLAVTFIPTLALTLGVWSRGSKLFEVVYPVLWYLGPFNPQNGLLILDYLGTHKGAVVNTSPLMVAGTVILLLTLAFLRRQRQWL